MYLFRDRRIIGSLLITLTLALVMFLTAGPERDPISIERFWVEFTAPVAEMMTDVADRADGAVAYILRYPTLLHENRELTRRIAELEAAENERALLEQENHQLQNLLGLVERIEVEGIPARVIGREPGSWNRELVINRGRDQGIRTDQVVVAPGGLVGRIRSVTTRTAKVMLLTSPESGIGVQVAANREPGVAEGQLLEPNQLRTTLFHPQAVVANGDVMVTSEIGERFPAGIPAGKVSAVDTDEWGLLKEVWVEPLVDLNRLSNVLVLEVSGTGRIQWWETVRDFPIRPEQEGSS